MAIMKRRRIAAPSLKTVKRTRRRSKMMRAPLRRSLRVSGIHFFKNKRQLTGIDPSNLSGEIARQYTFDITQVGNYLEYQALFDQYKIIAVKLEFRLKKQPGSLGAASQLPAMASVTDYDGEANVNNTYANLLARRGVRVTYFSDSNPYVKYYFRPKMLQQTVNIDATVNPPTFTAVGRVVKVPAWQDFGTPPAAAPAAQHFGMLVNAPGVGIGISSASIDVYQTLYFACRNQV